MSCRVVCAKGRADGGQRDALLRRHSYTTFARHLAYPDNHEATYWGGSIIIPFPFALVVVFLALENDLHY